MQLIVLDRDGVINEDSDQFVKSVDEWIPIDGSIEAIAKLCAAGFSIVVATNQSGIGRGLFSLLDLRAMHKKMEDLVFAAGGKISGVFFCPHHPDDHCNCRKPNPGLLSAIEQTLGVSVKDAIVIGDSLRDLQSGVSKGCIPILVKTGKGENTHAVITESRDNEFYTIPVFDNLAQAANFLIDNQNR